VIYDGGGLGESLNFVFVFLGFLLDDGIEVGCR
jgi:hypothetical protein